MISGLEFKSPIGIFGVILRDEIIIASGFCELTELSARVGLSAEDLVLDNNPQLSKKLDDYFSGKNLDLEDIKFEQNGTDFQEKVWKALLEINPGYPNTYKEIAKMVDSPKAIRAVGTTCGKNLLALFVPCHRAIRSDGSTGKYYYGPELKKWLLDHESKFM